MYLFSGCKGTFFFLIYNTLVEKKLFCIANRTTPTANAVSMITKAIVVPIEKPRLTMKGLVLMIFFHLPDLPKYLSNNNPQPIIIAKPIIIDHLPVKGIIENMTKRAIPTDRKKPMLKAALNS